MRRKAVITGASAGIGEEFARQLHSQGYDVLLVARRHTQLQMICNELNQIREQSAAFLTINLANPSSSEFAQLEGLLRNEPIEILINNAGFGSFGEFDTLSIERESEMIMLNVLAGTRLTHAVIPGMKLRRSGSLVIVSSVAGFQPLPYMATYSATKAFNYTQGLSLHYELAPYGVTVLTVCPGPVETEFGGVARMPGTVTGGARDSVSDVVSQSLSALHRGKACVVPCLRAKLMSIGSRIVPRTFSTKMVAKSLRQVWNRSRAQ